MATNAGLVLSRAATSRPRATAVIDGVTGQAWSYGALHRRARAVACWLEDSGVAAGDRVGLAMPNSADVVAAWFGIAYAGATIVPISTRSTPHETAIRLGHASARLHLTELPDELSVPVGGHPRLVDADSAAMILYTSGTTGEPKGARIGHDSLLKHTAALVEHTLDLTCNDRVLGVLPLSHSYGCRMAMLAPFMVGAATVLLPRFSATGSLSAMARHRVTWCPGVPTMFVAWGAAAAAARPSALRWCLSAGAPLSEPVRLAAQARLGAEVRQGYGMTEATFSTIDGPGAPVRPGTVGRPVRGVDVRVVDELAHPVPPGAVGQIIVRGPNLMLGYLDAPRATAERIVDGWVHSGDLGVISEDGWLTVVDRRDDVILRGGFTVYPSEVEAVLCAQPAVKNAAVIGLPDPFYGEVVVAVVVADGGVDSNGLAAAVSTLLGVDKRPSRYVFVDSLPQSPSGKVLKRVVQEYVTSPGARSTVAPVSASDD